MARLKPPKLRKDAEGCAKTSRPMSQASNRGGRGAAIAAFAALLAALVAAMVRPAGLPRSLLPFPGPKLAGLAQFAGAHAEKYLWGTYRPGFYFGTLLLLPEL